MVSDVNSMSLVRVWQLCNLLCCAYTLLRLVSTCCKICFIRLKVYPLKGQVLKYSVKVVLSLILYNNYSMSPNWIWSDKITNERVARVGYNHFISNKGEWNNCFSKFSNRVCRRFLFPQFYKASGKPKTFKLGALFSIWRKTPTIGS